jgi:uncharacterized protein YcnI
MKKIAILASVAAATAFSAQPALAHNVFTSMYAPAGYVQDLELRVTHGCKDSDVVQVRVRIPEEITRVSVNFVRDWTITTKKKKLPKPVPGEGGTMITEAVEEIVWSKPKSPLPASGFFEGFKFRVHLPNTPGAIVFFKTINDCVKGDDRYIDLPKAPLDLKAADFKQKLWEFMTATPTPAPFLILEKPDRPQYPWSGAEGPPPAAPAAAAPKR